MFIIMARKIYLDDTQISFYIEEERFGFESRFDLREAIELVLTPSQNYLFVTDYTKRIFTVSDKRYFLLKKWLSENFTIDGDQ